MSAVQAITEQVCWESDKGQLPEGKPLNSMLKTVEVHPRKKLNRVFQT